MVTCLAAFFFAYYFVNVARIPSAIKTAFEMKPHQRMKPFDCVTCLSVWTAVVLWLLPESVSTFIAVCFGAGFIGNKIK